ncbi:sorting nexin-19a [Aplochiton taeniatus]
MASLERPRHWSLSELLGQPRLLGFGALLAWLVLFHLLVNVWLLCIFTSLLVVLGGWLGSRAALDANSLLHLEHFVPLVGFQPAPHSPDSALRLEHEIHSAVHKAVRDFVSSWYSELLSEDTREFEGEVRDGMLEAVMDLKERARRVDRKALVQRVLELCGCHLQNYMRAKEMQAQAGPTEHSSLWSLYSAVDNPHPALGSEAAELSYARAVVNLVLNTLVPYPHMETKTGGGMVAELITCNVLLPLVSRVADPDWLNLTIVETFAKSLEPPEGPVEELPGAAGLYRSQIQHESWTTCHSASSDQSDLCRSSLSDLAAAEGVGEYEVSGAFSTPDGLEEDSLRDSLASLISTERVDGCHAGILRPCRPAGCFYQSPESNRASRPAGSTKPPVASPIRTDSDSDQADGLCDCTSPTGFCSGLGFEDEPLGCFGGFRPPGPKVPAPEQPHWPVGIAEEKAPALARRPPRLSPFHFEPAASSPDAEVRVQNVCVTGTATAKEQRGPGAHPYTLYTVKYETVASKMDSLQPVAHHTINRRYSEFLALQTRLEEKPELKKTIKNVKGPKKLFPDISFGNAEIDKVEARKVQLDVFVKQLSMIPQTANSEEMQDFLALNTAASPASEKKTFSLPRIDKMMVNAFDSLKTAFPRSEPMSPTEDLDGDPDVRAPPDRRRPRLRFPSKMGPSLSIPDSQPKVTYCFGKVSPEFHGLSLSGMESFVKHQERSLDVSPGTGPGAAKAVADTPGKDRKPCLKLRGADTAVADVALNILCLLMRDQWSWLCTENIQKAIRLLFGTFIERWLDVGMAHLTSAPCWVIYLQVMQEAVWPGGRLPTQPRPERSSQQREETRQQCLACLTTLLPELVTDLLGKDKYRLSLETVLESLQDPNINKHLVYCICDLLLEFLIPESSEQAFQRSLLCDMFGNVH